MHILKDGDTQPAEEQHRAIAAVSQLHFEVASMGCTVSHHHLTKKKSALAVEIAELEALEKRKQELLEKSAPLARTSTPPSSAAPPSTPPPPSDNEDEDEKDEKATNLTGVAVNFLILSIKSVCLQTELSGSGGIGCERTPHC